MAAADSDMQDPLERRYMEEEPQAAVIADVATNPAPPAMALEEAVGRVNPIYVVVPIVEADGRSYLQVARGGVFSYYEFPWPIADRLTNEKWRGMLDDGSAPPAPEWTASFLVDEIEYEEFSRAVDGFRSTLTRVYWYRHEEEMYAGGPGTQAILGDMRRLADAGRYMGHQLVGHEFRSFDLQSATLAVVTARETWRDTLYALSQYSPELDDAVLTQRGPYTLDATYTVELVDRGAELGSIWLVTNVVYAGEPPAFP